MGFSGLVRWETAAYSALDPDWPASAQQVWQHGPSVRNTPITSIDVRIGLMGQKHKTLRLYDFFPQLELG